METRLEGITESERRNVQDELASMKEDIQTMKVGSNCTVSRAASTGIGLGSGTHARQPLLASRWADSWVPRKLEFKGWSADWSTKHIQGIQDDQVKIVLKEIEAMMPTEVKQWIDWAQTKGNQGTWPKKTMVSLWFMHGTGKIMRVEILKMMRVELENKDYRVKRICKWVLKRIPGAGLRPCCTVCLETQKEQVKDEGHLWCVTSSLS